MIYEYNEMKISKGCFNLMKATQELILGEVFIEVTKNKKKKIIKKRILSYEEAEKVEE